MHLPAVGKSNFEYKSSTCEQRSAKKKQRSSTRKQRNSTRCSAIISLHSKITLHRRFFRDKISVVVFDLHENLALDKGVFWRKGLFTKINFPEILGWRSAPSVWRTGAMR